MKTLVFGAGPLGCLYAHLLGQAGKDVTILARGQRHDSIRSNSLTMVNEITGTKETTNVQVVDEFGPDDEYDLVLGDAERLPVRDRAFQLAYVHDGLHHLNSPEEGFSEMARIASEGILVTGPAKTLLTDAAIRLGLADIREESGSLVHRFSESELRVFCDQAMLQMPKLNRYLMYYRQRPFRFFQLFENRLLFSAFVILYMVTNLLFGRWGNKIALAARR